jgi:hypothetical protein
MLTDKLTWIVKYEPTSIRKKVSNLAKYPTITLGHRAVFKMVAFIPSQNFITVRQLWDC